MCVLVISSTVTKNVTYEFVHVVNDVCTLLGISKESRTTNIGNQFFN